MHLLRKGGLETKQLQSVRITASFFKCDSHWVLAIVLDRFEIDARAVGKQHPHHIKVPVIRRDRQSRGSSFHPGLIHGDVGFDQGLHGN